MSVDVVLFRLTDGHFVEHTFDTLPTKGEIIYLEDLKGCLYVKEIIRKFDDDDPDIKSMTFIMLDDPGNAPQSVADRWPM